MSKVNIGFKLRRKRIDRKIIILGQKLMVGLCRKLYLMKERVHFWQSG